MNCIALSSVWKLERVLPVPISVEFSKKIFKNLDVFLCMRETLEVIQYFLKNASFYDLVKNVGYNKL